MSTQILPVITGYCSIYVDDINMSELATSDPPLFARNMWQLLKPALAKFDHPPEMQKYIFGTSDNPKLIEPKYDDTTYTTSADYTTDIQFPLSTEYQNYDIVAARLKSYDKTGNVYYVPYECSFTEIPQIGIMVTISVPSGTTVPAGSVFDLDFYKDGYFANTLSPQMCDIIGLCFQYVWQDRFNTDWLSIVSKVEDKSFQEQNRANKMNADGMRLRELSVKLYDKMRKFEQDVAYNNTFPGGVGIHI